MWKLRVCVCGYGENKEGVGGEGRKGACGR